MAGRRYPHQLPADETLAEAARALEDGRLAGEVVDSEWRLRYVSTELRNLVGVFEDEQLRYGTVSIMRSSVAPEVWRLSEESQLAWWNLDGPYLRHDLGELPEEARGDVPALAESFQRFEPVEPPVAWAGKFATTFPDGSEASVGRLVVRLRQRDGSLAGTLGLYVGGGLRGSVQAMLSRGDDEMFERMAELTEPARRPAAVLFCDLEASGVHSRKLSSRTYFTLVRELTTVIDRAVIDHSGIVGKHVGDGVSAFFLAEQCGGEAGAAAEALAAARQVQETVARIEAGGEAPKVNVGVHWGATLVIGQVVTGGRLEVTALGDEVNQAARIQEVARGGRTLVSKDVLERLSDPAAAALGIDPNTTSYEILGEFSHATEKARRDAGSLAVAELPQA